MLLSASRDGGKTTCSSNTVWFKGEFSGDKAPAAARKARGLASPGVAIRSSGKNDRILEPRAARASL